MEGTMFELLDYFIILNIFVAVTYSVIIEIEDGKLEGIEMKTRKNVDFHAFLKIPYAEPPVGNLRFQPPIPNKKWNGTYNAKEFGPMCIQPKDSFKTSEDCLFLNVFTKNLNSVDLMPVIIFVHGGTFFEGSSHNHGPLYMLDRNVVLVTINYRVGAFGFLSTGTKEAVGNMGLKDQTLAFKWVHKNINLFGGDPHKITIAGLSAGGYSVTAHMASEMSKGLFHRVIAMSGAITSLGKVEDNHLDMAVYLADKLNCTTANVTNMISCLQEKPARDIVQIDITPIMKCIYGIPWVPVIEKDFGQERFLSQHPFEVFQKRNKSDVQVMLGLTEHEMIYIVPIILADKSLVKKWNENFNTFIAECFFLENHSKTTKLLRQVYVPFDDIDSRSFNTIGNLLSDGSIGYGVHRLVHMISSYTDVYYYKFSYVGRYSVFKYPRELPFGVTHADDLQYVLNTRYIGPNINENDPENFMVERMTRIWEQFAATGDPSNPKDSYLKDMVWPKHDAKDEHYLDIGKHFIEKKGLFLERFNAFDDLVSSATTLKSFLYLLILCFVVARLY